MGIPVVIATNGFGLPVVDATAGGLGVPMTVASNGYGTPVTVVTNGLGTPAVFTPPLGPAPPIPVLILAPIINNTTPGGSDTIPREGDTLVCTQGTWTNSPTSFTYQWYRWEYDT